MNFIRHSGTGRPAAVALVLCCLGFAIAPLWFYPVYLMKVMCYALLATSFNLLLTFAGLLSFGQAMYMGIGAYGAAYAAKSMALGPLQSLLFAAFIGGAIGLIVGFVAIRRQGIYFAMITLAFSQMMYFLIAQAPFSGGENGLQGVPRGMLFGVVDLSDQRAIYVFVLSIFALCIAAVYRLVYSPMGVVLGAIQQNESRSLSLGIRTTRYKLGVFTFAAALAAVGGGLKALVFQLAALPDAHWTMSGEAVLMALVGGVGTLSGPIIGSMLIVSLHNVMAQVDKYVFIVQGALFIAFALVFKSGLVGALSNRLGKPL